MSEINLPDVLGSLTGGQRINLSAAQVAVGLRPETIKAGTPTNVLLLLQNAADVDLDVTATLHLPERDAQKQKNRFMTKVNRLVIHLDPAQVGLATLPLTTLPDTAPAERYPLGLELKVTASARRGKPQRIRAATGGASFNPAPLQEDVQAVLKNLEGITWHTQANALRGGVLTLPLTVEAGKVGQLADLEPQWQSLWTMADHTDDMLLLQQFAPIISGSLLPALRRRRLVFSSVLEATRRYFDNSGYALQELERVLIAKLMTQILEFAAADRKSAVVLGIKDTYNLTYHLETMSAERKQLRLPHWTKKTLAAMNRNPRAIDTPVRAIAFFAYEDLLRDAMEHSFDQIEHYLQIEVGTQDERDAYIDGFFEQVQAQELTFETLYLPLIMGGILASDAVLVQNESPKSVVEPMRQMMNARYDELTDDTQQIYTMANQLIEHIFNKYSMNTMD